jgi:hypothetical protein
MKSLYLILSDQFVRFLNFIDTYSEGNTVAMKEVGASAHAQINMNEKEPETHTKRQAIQHDCLPSLLGDDGGK